MAEQLAHSHLGPSSAERWINCPGSVLATKGMKDVPSRFAAEGTAAHTLSEWCRVQGKKAHEFIGVKQTVEGFEFTVDAEMASAVQEFVDKAAEFGGDPFYEVRVSYEEYVPGGFGTADDIRIEDSVCKIVDLKFGKGVPVYAPENEQLMLYALGVYLTYRWLYKFDKFILAISQPRLDSYDEWETDLTGLLEFAISTVEPAAKRALQPGAPFKAGSWCQFCKIKATCRVRAESVFDAVTGEFADLEAAAEATVGVADKVPTLTNDEVAKALLAWPNIEKWGKALKAHAAAEMLAGRAVGDFKFVAGRGDRSWAEAEEVVVARLKEAAPDLCEDELYSTPVLLGPAKLEKLPAFGKKLFAPATKTKESGKLFDLVRKSKGKPTLVPGADPRPVIEIDPTSDFSEVTEEEID